METRPCPHCGSRTAAEYSPELDKTVIRTRDEGVVCQICNPVFVDVCRETYDAIEAASRDGMLCRASYYMTRVLPGDRVRFAVATDVHEAALKKGGGDFERGVRAALGLPAVPGGA